MRSKSRKRRTSCKKKPRKKIRSASTDFRSNELDERTLRAQLERLDFGNVSAGSEILVWQQHVANEIGSASLPLLRAVVPVFPKTPMQERVIHSVVEKLNRPLDHEDPEDVTVFYSLIAGLAGGEGFDQDWRAELVRSFEQGSPVAPLPLLRVGKGYSPIAKSIERDPSHPHRFVLNWTN